jgi:diaminopropionate ammonia-lyase
VSPTRNRIVFNDRLVAGAPRPLPPTIEFHRQFDAYEVTPLVELAGAARELDVRAVVLKNEQLRLGLPSFKLLGSSWAIHERIRRELGRGEREVLTLAALRAHVRAARATLCTASDGNYGRSVAALAQILGCASAIFLPGDTAASRIADIRQHGAAVHLVRGSYDETVARARAESAQKGHWYCPDTALAGADPGEMAFVRDVAIGYTTLVTELLGQLGRGPDVLFVQAGVGGLAAGAILALDTLSPQTRVVAVEPEASNSLQASIEAGEPRIVRDDFTMMAGLRCQSVSVAAWPLLRQRVAAAVTINDGDAARSMRELHDAGVIAGEAGAAGLAGARSVLADPVARTRLGVGSGSVIAALNTEGATDPVNYAAVIAGTRA